MNRSQYDKSYRGSDMGDGVGGLLYARMRIVASYNPTNLRSRIVTATGFE